MSNETLIHGDCLLLPDPGAAAHVAPTGVWSNDAPVGQMTIMPYEEFVARYGIDED